MSKLINATTVVGIATFLWYRKGRLWNFYDSLISKSSEQMKRNLIDRERWEKIALEQCALLSQETFQSLFRCEGKYLAQKIRDNQYEFWIPDSSATNEDQITYTNKEQYCKYIVRKLFLSDFRFCGLGLFVNSLRWRLSRREDKDPGYIKTQRRPKE